MNYLFFLLFIGVGVYTIVGATLEAEWFMGNLVAQVFVRRLGIRIFYMLLGMGLILIGFFGAFGLPDWEPTNYRIDPSQQ